MIFGRNVINESIRATLQYDNTFGIYEEQKVQLATESNKTGSFYSYQYNFLYTYEFISTIFAKLDTVKMKLEKMHS